MIMKEKILKTRLFMFVVYLAVVSFCLINTPAYGRAVHSQGGGYVSHSYGVHGYSYSHYYHSGGWHSRGWFGFDYAVGVPPVGAVVPYLPFGCRRIIIGGLPYYFYDDIYFSPCPVGYIVVPAPDADDSASVVVPESNSAPASNSEEGSTITINIPNSKGGFKPIKLTKKDGGYVGPQGEFYPGHPSVAQLKALYGE
jgi:hypothetical protein